MKVSFKSPHGIKQTLVSSILFYSFYSFFCGFSSAIKFLSAIKFFMFSGKVSALTKAPKCAQKATFFYLITMFLIILVYAIQTRLKT